MVLLASVALWLILLVCAALLLTVGMHVWLGVPYVPTPHKVVKTMVELAELRGNETVMDLGAGDGRLLAEAKRRYPGIRAIGCELVPTVWLLGVVTLWLRRAKVTLLLKDSFKQDVSGADVIFLYLMPSLLAKLQPKFDRELKPGAKIVSHSFRFPERTPLAQRTVKTLGGSSIVYLYVW